MAAGTPGAVTDRARAAITNRRSARILSVDPLLRLPRITSNLSRATSRHPSHGCALAVGGGQDAFGSADRHDCAPGRVMADRPVPRPSLVPRVRGRCGSVSPGRPGRGGRPVSGSGCRRCARHRCSGGAGQSISSPYTFPPSIGWFWCGQIGPTAIGSPAGVRAKVTSASSTTKPAVVSPPPGSRHGGCPTAHFTSQMRPERRQTAWWWLSPARVCLLGCRQVAVPG